MSTAEMIQEKASKLPDELQQEALRFVDSLLARQAELNERHTWSRFSAQQLSNPYSPADAIYDQD
jgi:hypothetical protein